MTVMVFLEWTWTIVHLLGLVFVIALMVDAFGDVRATAPAMLARFGLTNGRREIYALMYLRGRLVALIIHAPSLVAGVIALAGADPDPTPTRVFTACTFILFAVVVDGLTVLDLRDRMRIRRYAAAKP